MRENGYRKFLLEMLFFWTILISNLSPYLKVSGAACLKMIDKFVVNPDETSTAILNLYNVHIIPILNPDGFEYSREKDRSWRKNRSKNLRVLPFCKGVDVNRNFDVKFGTVGVDPRNPCSLVCSQINFDLL